MLKSFSFFHTIYTAETIDEAFLLKKKKKSSHINFTLQRVCVLRKLNGVEWLSGG